MENNRILIVANGIIGEDPGLSGGDVRFLELVRYWLKEGQQVELLSSESAKGICHRFGIDVPIHIIPNISHNSERMTYIVRTLQTCVVQPKSLSNFEGIVYSVNDSLFDVIPALRLKLSNPKKVKWAAVIHWIPPFPPWKRRKSTLFNSVLFFINERISIWLAHFFADVLLPVSESTAEQIRRIHLNMRKVHTVKCGVNFTLIRNIAKTIKQKKYDLVFMKRVQSVKGIFDFIEILEKVAVFKKDLKAIIIGGDGHDAEIVKQEIVNRNLDKHVEFAGYIFDQKYKFEKLAQGKLFILPSYEENWAIVVGEAMAAGVPVISYKLPELTQIWKNHVTWIPLGNTDMVVKAILEQLEDDNRLELEIANNLRFIRDFDWKKIALEELQILSRL